MAIFGIGDASKDASKNSTKKNAKKNDGDNNSQADEAKALLAKMEAKKDAEECPFC